MFKPSLRQEFKMLHLVTGKVLKGSSHEEVIWVVRWSRGQIRGRAFAWNLQGRPHGTWQRCQQSSDLYEESEAHLEIPSQSSKDCQPSSDAAPKPAGASNAKRVSACSKILERREHHCRGFVSDDKHGVAGVGWDGIGPEHDQQAVLYC